MKVKKFLGTNQDRLDIRRAIHRNLADIIPANRNKDINTRCYVRFAFRNSLLNNDTHHHTKVLSAFNAVCKIKIKTIHLNQSIAGDTYTVVTAVARGDSTYLRAAFDEYIDAPCLETAKNLRYIFNTDNE